jgi:hypothetical protein
LVISRNDVTRRVTVTVNGRRAWSFVDAGEFAVFNGTDQVMRFFEDDVSEHPSGTVKSIRVYNTDLVRDRSIAAKRKQCTRLVKALKKAKKSKVKSRILRAKKKLAKCKKQLRRL